MTLKSSFIACSALAVVLAPLAAAADAVESDPAYTESERYGAEAYEDTRVYDRGGVESESELRGEVQLDESARGQLGYRQEPGRAVRRSLADEPEDNTIPAQVTDLERDTVDASDSGIPGSTTSGTAAYREDEDSYEE
ncbi:MAG: hypothetical protein J5J00_02530 [Deltaproteobacteria bacterium]|nr:hypothetical protein [Deltaproteobacteria bacterium]